MAIIAKVNGITFLEQWIEVNMDKIEITIFQGNVVTQTVLGGLTNYASSDCKFPIVYMCQKLWKLINIRQSYCNENRVQFFGPLGYLWGSVAKCSKAL